MRLNIKMVKTTLFVSLVFSSLFFTILSIQGSSYTKQDFEINDDSRTFLDLESDQYYNGTLSVTVTAYDAAGNSASATKDDITVYCLGIL